VIFLRSAAVGAEAYYSSETNLFRDESAEEARALDERLLHAWTGVAHISVIENRQQEGFKEKIHRSIRALARSLGYPEPIEQEVKFRLQSFRRNLLPSHTADIEILQNYLLSREGTNERVRARGQENQWVYFHTIKEPRGEGVSVERERIITKHEYEMLLVKRDPARLPIYKTRSCFFYENQYIEVDQFHGHRQGMIVMEIEKTEEDTAVFLPPYLDECEEVTGNAEFSNYNLALPLS